MSRVNASIPAPKRNRKAWMLAPLILAAVGYIGAIAYLRINESSFIYQPDTYGGRAMVEPEADLRVEATRVRGADSLDLVTWLLPPKDSTTATSLWILVCHGTAGNISLPLRQQWSRALLAQGVGIVSFDYRGYGASADGPLDEEGLYRDARAVYDWMTGARGIDPQHIIIYGHSLGTGVASHLAARVEAAGLILEGAFTSVPDVAATRFGWLPVRLIASERYATIERIDSIAMPKLILHASDDSVIPIEFGQRLFAAAGAPKEFVALTGGHDRAFAVDSLNYFGAIGKFVRAIATVDVESPPPPAVAPPR